MSTDTAVTSRDGFHATPSAQRADDLVRGLFDAINAGDQTSMDQVLARSLLSYDVHGVRSRNGLKRYYADLRRSFSELRFEVHENIANAVRSSLSARALFAGHRSRAE